MHDASASRSSRSRTPEPLLSRDLGAAGRVDPALAFEDFVPRRIGLSSLLRRMTIVPGGDDRLCEGTWLGKSGRRGAAHLSSISRGAFRSLHASGADAHA